MNVHCDGITLAQTTQMSTDSGETELCAVVCATLPRALLQAKGAPTPAAGGACC